MTVQELKQHIYKLEPTETKEIFSYCSVLIRERTHSEVNSKNKILIMDYKRMVEFIEDTFCMKIITHSRKQESAFARYCLYKFIQDELIKKDSRKNATYATLISKIFNKNHASVILGLRVYNSEIGINKDLQYMDTQIKSIIKTYRDTEFIDNVKNQINDRNV